MDRKRKKLRELTAAMAEIGLIGFGGGSALIPIIEKEAVEERRLASREDLDRSVVVASLTPGALPVEIAAGIGYGAAGHPGMLLAALGMAFPGALLTVILLILLADVPAALFTQISYISVGISVYIIYLLLCYIGKSAGSSVPSAVRVKNIFLVLIVFLLNGGKELYAISGINRTPVFDLSSIQVMGLSFFLILFLSVNRRWYHYAAAASLSALFLACTGKAGYIENESVKCTVYIGMGVLAAYGLAKALRSDKAEQKTGWKPVCRTFFVWLAFMLLLLLPVILRYGVPFAFLGRGLLSSALSFGGGDAFLSVAEGMFVETGMIGESVFYGNIVTVVNILPGSILCKTLTGIGYAVGFEAYGSTLAGILWALGGFGVSVFGSCSIFMICYQLYSRLEGLSFFRMIGSNIRPVVGGLLIGIILSLLKKVEGIGAAGNLPAWLMYLNCAALLGGILLSGRKKQKFGWTILFTAILSCVLCNLGI